MPPALINGTVWGMERYLGVGVGELPLAGPIQKWSNQDGELGINTEKYVGAFGMIYMILSRASNLAECW
jgi:hypothetical protein